MAEHFEVTYGRENQWKLKKTLSISGETYKKIKEQDEVEHLINEIYIDFFDHNEFPSYFPDREWIKSMLSNISTETYEKLTNNNFPYQVIFYTTYTHIDHENTPTYSLGNLKCIYFEIWEDQNKALSSIEIKPYTKWWQRLFQRKNTDKSLEGL